MEDAYQCITLCLIGVSGSGKTALMSKLASIFSTTTTLSVPVLIRFCGTSKYSTNGLLLVQSLCHQIACIYNLPEQTPFSTSYEDTVSCFHKYLSEYPIILFIDSLDQLSDNHEARSRISFLIDSKPHPNTRIIVSALPDEINEVTKKWIYCYQCDTRLKSANVPRLLVEKFSVETEGSNNNIYNSEVAIILKELLRQQSRVLQEHQFQYLLTQAAVEPTVLYLNLAVSIARKWKSFDSEVTLQPTVKGVINQILDSLERDFGRQLTRYALGFITFSRLGRNNITLN